MSAGLSVTSNSDALGLAEAQSAGQEARPDGSFVLSNDRLSWNLEWHGRRLSTSGFENKLSGHTFPFSTAHEIALTFQASRHRIEIPWWTFTFGPDEADVSPDQEQGLRLGYHRPEFSEAGWGAAENLLLRGLQGVRNPRGGITYDGYGWFRRWFEWPSDARAEEIVFTLGGYDQLDWNEYWIYVNGVEMGHRSSSGRWRTPGQHRIAPASPGYQALRFGSGEKNLLSVRTRGYDKHFGGLNEEVLKHYVFEPVLVDQFISVGEPYQVVSDFEVRKLNPTDRSRISFELRSTSQPVSVSAHYEVQGAFRRKWLEITNTGDRELLLLDAQIDDLTTSASTTEGGWGEPIFISEEAFAAIEHPAGLNQGDRGRIKLSHFPARRIAPGDSIRTHAAIFGVAPQGKALEQFVSYIQEGSPRKKKAISLYTPYGINNQWGGCPALADFEVLNTLDVLEKLQRKGLKFDYFTLDQGWNDPAADLTRFAPQCYPEGPAKFVERVEALGMKFGLWFSVSGAGWSCGEYPPVAPSFSPVPGKPEESHPAPLLYRNGYVANGGVPGSLCPASEPYFSVLRDAILYHIKHNNLKFFKLDIGNYYCNSTRHDHLPGKYSVEAIYERLIEIAAAARKAEPDVYVMWYWGLRSPFFALHGDSIFESGLFMEGSGTSWFPTLYYRDSVTLNLDQSTVFAKTIPPLLKDSLGVWLADTRWGNFMGNQRWKEGLVMDLGRGNLLFPQFWSDINLLNDREVDFLVELVALVRKNESLFLGPRKVLGDPWKNEVYGYSYFKEAHGLVFLSNCHFASRLAKLRLDGSTGFSAPPGTPVSIVSHFPESRRVVPEHGSDFKAGDIADVWVRPFEVLMLEVAPASDSLALPAREIFAAQAADLGIALPLEPTSPAGWMNAEFADAARFEQQGFKKKSSSWSCTLPSLAGDQPILAVAVRLREGNIEWRYSPAVAEIVELVAHIGDQKVQLIPVPDARQYGNTQKAGCSWVVYKMRLNPQWSGRRLQFAVHTYLPQRIEARIDAWVVRQWWEEGTRPLGDGYYGDEPS